MRRHRSQMRSGEKTWSTAMDAGVTFCAAVVGREGGRGERVRSLWNWTGRLGWRVGGGGREGDG